MFHRGVTQLLLAAFRVRQDVQTAVAFLTTRVEGSDKDDRGKPKRVFKYLQGTKQAKLTLCADSLNVVK